MNRDESTRMADIQAQINELRLEVDSVSKQVDVVERRIDVIQVNQDAAKERGVEIVQTQKEMDQKMDILVDRVADNRLENYKAGGIAAVVGGLIQFLSWQARQ
jgi:hypothetical protein